MYFPTYSFSHKIYIYIMNNSPESLSITQRLASPRPPPPPPPTEESLELEESSDESDELEESSDPAAAQNFDMVAE